MAKKLKSYKFPITNRNSAYKYPWDQWANGIFGSLRKGKIFKSK